MLKFIKELFKESKEELDKREEQLLISYDLAGKVAEKAYNLQHSVAIEINKIKGAK